MRIYKVELTFMSIPEKLVISYQKEFGKNVKRLRHAKGLSQLDLTVLCGMEKTAISRIENGRTNVTIKTIVILGYYLDVSTTNLFNEMF